MTLTTKTTLSMALSLAGSVTTAPLPAAPENPLSLPRAGTESEKKMQSTMDSNSPVDSPREFSLYKGVSDRPLGWKIRRKIKPVVGQVARDANIKRWDAAARKTTEWDGLRRDPELWYPEGDCLVHLYGHGQSKRGPAFKVPFEDLLNARCRPLIDRFLVQDFDMSPTSESSSNNDGEYWDSPAKSSHYELYIPAPPAAERSQAMFHHIATRNFFAWIFKKPMVGPRLGGSLVALLNSMNEFRSAGVDSIEDILDYMDQEGYADMRDQPDYALAILFFAEHFQFRDIWIDAYAHCAGMHERLTSSSEFKHISRMSRTLISYGRLEMDTRLKKCGKSLSAFLEDELSTANLGISAAARDHLDRFRAFLQAYYVEKFGYYPPSDTHDGISVFSKSIYELMATEFQNLYEFLVDENFTSSDTSPVPAQGGICVLQNVQAFDQRNHHEPLPHPLPLLPRASWDSPRLLKPRISWTGRLDKFKVDERLIKLSSLAKASNRGHADLMECPLVKAYCSFERDYLFSSLKSERTNKVSIVDARKVCWIMVYGMLQTLLAATTIPDEVRDTQDVPYNLCVRIAGCPPWQDEIPSASPLCKYSSEAEQDWDDFSVEESTNTPNSPYMESPDISTAIKPDIDYFQLTRRSSRASTTSSAPSSPVVTRKGTIRRALSTLGNMPELRHPRPVRNAFHEILVHGYGNGLNTVSIGQTTSSAPEFIQYDGYTSSGSLQSPSYSDMAFSQTWSGSDSSPPSSVSDFGHHDLEITFSKSTASHIPENFNGALVKKSSSIYSDAEDGELSHLRPEPLDIPGKDHVKYRLTDSEGLELQYDGF